MRYMRLPCGLGPEKIISIKVAFALDLVPKLCQNSFIRTGDGNDQRNDPNPPDDRPSPPYYGSRMSKGAGFWRRQQAIAQRKFTRAVGDEALQAICNRIHIYRVIEGCAAWFGIF